jgi:hypothetical protein
MPIFAGPIASDSFESDRKTVVDVRRMNGVCFLSQHGIDYVRGYVDDLNRGLRFLSPRFASARVSGEPLPFVAAIGAVLRRSAVATSLPSMAMRPP